MQYFITLLPVIYDTTKNNQFSCNFIYSSSVNSLNRVVGRIKIKITIYRERIAQINKYTWQYLSQSFVLIYSMSLNKVLRKRANSLGTKKSVLDCQWMVDFFQEEEDTWGSRHVVLLLRIQWTEREHNNEVLREVETKRKIFRIRERESKFLGYIMEGLENLTHTADIESKRGRKKIVPK